MEIILSRHAKRQMKWRKITAEEVEETILHPEKVEDSIKGRKNAFKHINAKRLKVTFTEKHETITIVTAINKNQ